MPPFSTQVTPKIGSISKTVIEPSLREGEILYKGILQPDEAVPIPRDPPDMLVAPSISGDFRIPSILTCNPGVWDGSPRPKYRYQWKSNGVSIVGATESTWLSDSAYEFTDITCEVEAYNILGRITVVSSNSIRIEPVYPARIENYEVVAPTNMSTAGTIQFPSLHFNYVQRTSSIGFESIFGIQTLGVMAFPTKGNQVHQEVTTIEYFGMPSIGTIKAYHQHVNLVMALPYSGIQTNNNLNVIAIDPELNSLKTSQVPVSNEYAQDGINGWTISSGYFGSYGNNPNYFRIHSGDDAALGSVSEIYQEINFSPDQLTKIQAESYDLVLNSYHYSYGNDSTSNILTYAVRFLDASNNIIGSEVTVNHTNRNWAESLDSFGVIPSNAVKIRLYARSTKQYSRGWVYFTRLMLYMNEVA